MLKDTLFLQALLDHLDQIVALLGNRWITIRENLLPLLTGIIKEDDADKVTVRVFQGTAAETLTRNLFRQGTEQAELEASTAHISSMTGPATIAAVLADKLAVRPADLEKLLQELSQPSRGLQEMPRRIELCRLA